MTRQEQIEMLARKAIDRQLGTPPQDGQWPESYFDCHDMTWRQMAIERVENFFDDLEAAGLRVVA